MSREERRQKEVATYLEWVRENVPQLAFRSEDYQKQVITFAIEQTRGTQFWLGMVFAVLTGLLSIRLLQELGVDRDGKLQHALIMTVAGAVFAYVSNLAGRILARRRIRELAGPSPEQYLPRSRRS